GDGFIAQRYLPCPPTLSEALRWSFSKAPVEHQPTCDKVNLLPLERQKLAHAKARLQRDDDHRLPVLRSSREESRRLVKEQEFAVRQLHTQLLHHGSVKWSPYSTPRFKSFRNPRGSCWCFWASTPRRACRP